MAAIEASAVRLLTGQVPYVNVGSSDVKYQEIILEATTTAVDNTLDLSTVCDATAILGPVLETVDGAVAATASTWSGTTVTFAGHTGSGGYKAVWRVIV